MTADVLDRLIDHYAAAPAPAPSAALLARMDAGAVGILHHATPVADDEARDAVVVPFTPRPRAKIRYLVAATVSTFVVFSGLAVAGALPDSLQRGVASVVSQVGIDLPDPGSSPPPTNPPSGGNGGNGGSQTTAGGGSTGGSTGGTNTANGGHPNGTTPQSTTAPTTLPGGATVPPTTAPALLGLPPVSLPPVSLPPELGLPPVTVPPLSLPPTPLDPILNPLLDPILHPLLDPLLPHLPLFGL